MKAKIVLGLFLCSFLFMLSFLALTDRSQAQPNAPALIPREPIVMWSGTLASIPKGWQLCDGSNGTPDLCDRFVLGAYSGGEVGEIGGANDVQLTVSNLPSHSHAFTTYQGGGHDHTWMDSSTEWYLDRPDGIYYQYDGCYNKVASVQRVTNSDGAHDHTGFTDSQGSSTPIDNRPAYYRLAFITRR